MSNGVRTFVNHTSFTRPTYDTYLGSILTSDHHLAITADMLGTFIAIIDGNGMQGTLPQAFNQEPVTGYAQGGAQVVNGWFCWIRNVGPAPAVFTCCGGTTVNGGPALIVNTNACHMVVVVQGNYLTYP